MSRRTRTTLLAGAFAGVTALSLSASTFAFDAEAAKATARKNSCLRCHSVDKEKEGPSYHAIAYKYKGQTDAADKLLRHITSGEDRVKLSDGHMEDHKVAKNADPEHIRNLIEWILAQ